MHLQKTDEGTGYQCVRPVIRDVGAGLRTETLGFKILFILQTCTQGEGLHLRGTNLWNMREARG